MLYKLISAFLLGLIYHRGTPKKDKRVAKIYCNYTNACNLGQVLFALCENIK